ncbi:ion channel [Roseovarius sp. CH_XMU1461]|jgi:hypothetical protein
MVLQLLIGSALLAATALLASMSWMLLEMVLRRTHPWIIHPPYGLKLAAVLLVAMLWVLCMMTLSIWIWAVVFWRLDVFESFEGAVYFALVAFTTLGFGDVLLPQPWRLLGGLAAANGLMIFGFLTAMLVETLRQTRYRQLGPVGQDDD